MKNDMLTFALPKGRILKDAIPMFKRAGMDIAYILDDDRKLIFEDKKAGLRLMILRASDVPTYVEHGAADLGIAGKDVLEEETRDLYEPLDLRLGICRMSVAMPKNISEKDKEKQKTYLKVATKYPNIAIRHFQKKGVQLDIIKLYGSIEIAPLTGLSDKVVDLIETGSTLKRNGLIEDETIMHISSRLIVNRASLKTRPKEIKSIVEKFKKAIK